VLTFAASLPVFRLSRALSIFGLACVGLGAGADVLPAMTAYSSVTVFGGSPNAISDLNCSGFGSCGRSTGYVNQYANSSVSAGPVMATSIDSPGWSDGIPGYAGAGGTLYGEVSGTLTYTFAVVGPTQLVVPIVMTGAIYLDAGFTPTAIGGTGSGNSNGHAYLRVANNYPASPHYVRGDAYTASCDPVNRTNCNTGFTLSTTMMSSTTSTLGEIAWVELAADSNFYVSYGLRTFASATVDPFVQIAPGFLADHPGYSLIFADGVTNQAASVPEGSTWLLLLGGLAFVSTAVRSRRRK